MKMSVRSMGLCAAIATLAINSLAFAGFGWGIYEPINGKIMNKSTGTYKCSGIADLFNSAIQLKFKGSGGTTEETKDGTSGAGPFGAWEFTLN